MPFKSKKQKKTIDAAAHNPAFAKKVGIKVSDAKKMSAHGKGQTKFEEAKDTVEKDEKGNVISWKHEGDWTKSKGKDGRGKVTNLSDKARRETEKLSKAEKEMAESFEKAISEVKVTSGANKGKEWSPKNPGPTNPNYKPFDKNGIPSPDDGATAPPPGYKAPKTMKKAEVTTDVEEPTVAEAKQTYGGKGPKKTKSEHDSEVKKKKEKEKFKKMAEAFVQIGRLEQMIMEAKKAKCTCETNEDTCKVHSKMEEGLKGKQKKLDVNHNGDIEADDLAKLRAGKTAKKVKEGGFDPERAMRHATERKKKEEQGYEKTGPYTYKKKKAEDKKDDKVSEAKEKEPEGLYSKKRFETDSQRIARLAKEKKQAEKKKESDKVSETKEKCNHTPKGKKCPVHGVKECGGMYEGSKVDQNKDGKNDFEDVKIARMKAAMKGKSKKVKESWTHDSLAAELFETDEYMMTLHESLQRKLKG